MKYIGTITNPKGLQGKMTVTKVPEGIKKLKKGTKILIGYSENFARPYEINHWETKGKNAIFSIVGINKPEDTISLKEQGIFIDEKHLKFTDEKIFVEELIGKSKITSNEEDMPESEFPGYTVIDIHTRKTIGKIIDVWILPANDVWLVKTEEGELPLPVIDDIIKKIDKKKKTIEIEIISGLMDIIDTKKR